MCRVVIIAVIVFLCASAMGQEGVPTKALPDGWDEWTPDDGMLRLYVNFDGRSGDTLPRIDILCEDGSWPFSMQYLRDTVFLFVVPPGCELTERSTLNNLPDEFPFVVCAGTKRAVYWFSYDAGKVEIDILQPASFITTILVKPFPPDVMYLLLPGSGKHAKTIKKIVRCLKDMATLYTL